MKKVYLFLVILTLLLGVIACTISEPYYPELENEEIDCEYKEYDPLIDLSNYLKLHITYEKAHPEMPVDIRVSTYIINNSEHTVMILIHYRFDINFYFNDFSYWELPGAEDNRGMGVRHREVTLNPGQYVLIVRQFLGGEHLPSGQYYLIVKYYTTAWIMNEPFNDVPFLLVSESILVYIP